MAVIRFDPNKPVEVALKFSDGLHVKSKKFPDRPEEVMYTVSGGDTMYVPLVVEEQIKSLGVRRMDLISICKHVVNKRVQWRVARVESAPVPEAPADQREEVERVKAQQAQRTPAGPGVHTPGTTRTQNAQFDDSADGPVNHTLMSRMMAAALIAAIDAAAEAEKYAKSKYMSLEFVPEDLVGMATTMFNEATRRRPFGNVEGKEGGSRVWRQ